MQTNFYVVQMDATFKHMQCDVTRVCFAERMDTAINRDLRQVEQTDLLGVCIVQLSSTQQWQCFMLLSRRQQQLKGVKCSAETFG